MNATRYHRRMGVALLISILLAATLSGLRLFPDDSTTSKVDLNLPTRRNESLHHHPATLLGRQVDHCDWENIVKNSQVEPDKLGYCERLYVKGSQLMCMLSDASQSRNEATGEMEYHWATSWTNPGSLADWGWEFSTADDGFELTDMNEILEDININQRKMFNIVLDHETETEHDGVVYPETSAKYDNWISDDFSVILADVNSSPEYGNRWRLPEEHIPQNQITKLRNWSDGFGLGLALYAQHKALRPDFMSNLQHVFRHEIINEETRKIMRMVFEISDLADLPTWPGWTVHMEDPKMAVLLTSPNARGVAWLLGQHKATMGVKVITSITGFRCGRGQPQVCMYLKIGNPPSGQ